MKPSGHGNYERLSEHKFDSMKVILCQIVIL